MNCTTPTRLPRPSMRSAKPEGRGRFAFAGAGMDDEEPLLDLVLPATSCVLHRLALRHLGAMALGFLVVDWLGHGLFTAIGDAGHHHHHALRLAASLLIELALQIAEAPGEAHCRARAQADLVRDENGRTRSCGESLLQAHGLGVDVEASFHQIREPERQAIDQDRRLCRRLLQARRRDRAAPRSFASLGPGALYERRCAPPSPRPAPRPSPHRPRAWAILRSALRRSGFSLSGRRRARASQGPGRRPSALACVNEPFPEQAGKGAEQHPEQQRRQHHGDDEAVMQAFGDRRVVAYLFWRAD